MKLLNVMSVLAALMLTGCAAAEVSGGSSDRSVTAEEAPHGQTEESQPAVSEDSVDGEALFQIEYDEAVRQRDISGQVEYVPVKKTGEVRYGNLPQNFTSKTLPGLICPDTENDILYFTNLSDGETLCKLENGAVTELLPVTAKSINLWDGYLYYICDSDNPVGIPRNKSTKEFRITYTGDIYRYNITTGENELLIETDAYTLIVSDNGLDYSAGRNYSCEKLNYEQDMRYYHADFDGGNVVENPAYPIIDDFLGIYYGEYQLEAADGAMTLRNMGTGECAEVLSRKETCNCASIVGDILYYCPNFSNNRLNTAEKTVSRSELCGIDLASGETFSAGKMGFMTDYAVIGGKIYLCSGLDFSVYENGKSKNITLELHGFNDTTHEFAALYTDGKRLYAADDRKGIYNVEEGPYSTTMIYYEIGGTPWKQAQ